MRTIIVKHELEKNAPKDNNVLCFDVNPVSLPVYDSSEEWVQEYKKQFGEETKFLLR